MAAPGAPPSSPHRLPAPLLHDEGGTRRDLECGHRLALIEDAGAAELDRIARRIRRPLGLDQRAELQLADADVGAPRQRNIGPRLGDPDPKGGRLGGAHAVTEAGVGSVERKRATAWSN